MNIAIGALALYLLGYAVFRQTHTEIWEKDKQSYVIFPSHMTMLYYLWRPLSYIDESATGMKSHIGPHQ